MSTRRTALAISLIASSTLVYEVLLTRVSALRLAFHFSFLVVSIALFAVGVAGAVLTFARNRTLGSERRYAAAATGLFVVSLPLAYAFLLLWPVPAQFRLADLASVASLGAFNAVAAVPFAFGGAAVGLLLQGAARDVHRVYAADLIGAALGCLATPFMLWGSGAGGTLCLAGALAALGLGTLLEGRGRSLAALAIAGLFAAGAPLLDARFPVPSKTELRLTEDSVFLAGESRVLSRWSALSRVDVDAIAPEDRNLFLRPPAVPMPRPERQVFIMQDGSAGTYVHDYTGTPEALGGLSLSLYSLASRIVEPTSVFIIGAGGGDDLWATRHAGAKRIKAIELNRAIIDLHENTFRDFSRDMIEDPGVEIVHAEGRSALLRETGRYDLVQMSAIDTWTALQSGAYMLAENFLYTRDAIHDMVSVLEPGGTLQITRFSGDVEALRLLATLRSVHGELGQGPFHECIACVPAGAYLSVVMKRSPFTATEIARLDRFLDESEAPVAVHPARRLGGPLEEFARSTNPQRILDEATFDLSPVSDDRPYFFHFHRWNDLSRARADLDAPMVVTQGNPLFLIGQLLIALIAALLVLVPSLLKATARSPHRGRRATAAFGYFGSVGAGYVVIQVALIQKLVLLVGHPLHSLTVTLFGMLLATGAGAYLSRNRFGPTAPASRFVVVPAGLALLLGGFAAFSPELVAWAVPRSDAIRFAVALGVVAPVGLLMGIPFAHGIRVLEEHAPELVPWGWSANAATTVVGSILAVIVSINFGFDAVFAGGVALYGAAALSLRRLGP